MRRCFNSCTMLSVSLCISKKTITDEDWALYQNQHPQAVLSVSAPCGRRCEPLLLPRGESLWPCADSRAGKRKGTVSLICVRRAAGRRGAIVAPPLVLHSQAQSFLVLLALTMFSCRFFFFFCSRSRASIILASFQDNSALAMKRGVSASMTVVRKP